MADPVANPRSMLAGEPRIGSLCSGYGGLDLGLMAVVGGSVAWHVEYDANPSAVLDARFPGVPNYGDLTRTDWTQVEPVQWLTAGYPCQPFSSAGKRRGSEDERHLWPFVADAIGVLRPERVLLENVDGHLTLGLDAVLWDLAALGYDATWGVVRASDAGACHTRKRVFIVAADTSGDEGRQQHGDGLPPVGHSARSGRNAPADAEGRPERSLASGGSGGAPADTSRPAGRGQELSDLRAAAEQAAEPGERSGEVAWGRYGPAIRRWERITGRAVPDPIDAENRLSPRFVEWMQGLADGWVTEILDPSPARKALGNGVVPQQAALAVRALLSLAEREVAA